MGEQKRFFQAVRELWDRILEIALQRLTDPLRKALEKPKPFPDSLQISVDHFLATKARSGQPDIKIKGLPVVKISDVEVIGGGDPGRIDSLIKGLNLKRDAT